MNARRIETTTGAYAGLVWIRALALSPVAWWKAGRERAHPASQCRAKEEQHEMRPAKSQSGGVPWLCARMPRRALASGECTLSVSP